MRCVMVQVLILDDIIENIPKFLISPYAAD